MKKAYIVHGWAGSPDESMLKWIREKLQERGFDAVGIAMSHPDVPIIKDWVNTLKTECKDIDENTYFIGHSVGCQTILRFLETLPADVKAKQVILIAPWVLLTVENLDETEEKEIARPWMETPIDYEKVKLHADSFVGIFSDNDPFVPLVKNENLFKEKLNAKTIIMHDKGHFTESDNVISLPEALEEIN